jgi:2-haloacid dehalogenase
MPPWPDSVAGIAAIRRGYVTGPLSNGNTSLLLDMAKAAGLPWDVILGSDVSQAYKPAPEAYRRPAALLGLSPGEVMLAAAHQSDLAAARAAGLATAFIARPFEHGPAAAGGGTAVSADWDLAGDTIPAIAAQL